MSPKRFSTTAVADMILCNWEMTNDRAFQTLASKKYGFEQPQQQQPQQQQQQQHQQQPQQPQQQQTTTTTTTNNNNNNTNTLSPKFIKIPILGGKMVINYGNLGCNVFMQTQTMHMPGCLFCVLIVSL